MEFKDITVAAELKEVRGGNAIIQNSENYGVTGLVSVGGYGFNGSPVTVSSSVLQANKTDQAAAISDVYKRDTKLSLTASQVFAGFPYFN